jgi:uncharacterized protein
VNFEEARRQAGLAAAQGDADAQVVLGLMIKYRKGGQVDLGESLRQFRLAAAQDDMVGQYHLARLLYEGEGGAKDLMEARRMFALALAHGEDTTPQGDPSALNMARWAMLPC